VTAKQLIVVRTDKPAIGHPATVSVVTPALLCGTTISSSSLNLAQANTPGTGICTAIACFVLVPKVGHLGKIIDYRPVALMSHIIKSLEWPLLWAIRLQVGQAVDPLPTCRQRTLECSRCSPVHATSWVLTLWHHSWDNWVLLLVELGWVLQMPMRDKTLPWWGGSSAIHCGGSCLAA